MSERPAEPATTAGPERCADCGGALALTDAVVYHGLVYHPACASGVRLASQPPAVLRPAPDRWPFGVPEFNCTGDL
jgi:hypothetical protein